jgi:hypothetical protein
VRDEHRECDLLAATAAEHEQVIRTSDLDVTVRRMRPPRVPEQAVHIDGSAVLAQVEDHAPAF